jgi:DNA-binding transcriptional LysR family regulator
MNIFDGRLPDVHELQALVSIMEEGTVTRAAEKLGVSQSSLSHTLEKMRVAFDDPLFVRVGNRMEASALAKKLRDPAVQVLQILESGIVGLKQFDPRTTTTEFRVGVNELGAVALIPKLSAHLCRAAPRSRLVTVHVRPDDVRSMLENDQVDVVAGYFPEMAPGVPHLHLFDTRAVCIASAGHSRIGDSISLAQLARTPCVETKLMAYVRAIAAEAAGQPPRKPFVYCATNHLPAIPLIVASSDLIAVVPAELFSLFGHAFNLKQVRIEAQLPTVGVSLYWHKRTQGDPAVEFLRDAISSQQH